MSGRAARWVEMVTEQSHRAEEYRRSGERMMADLLLGRTMIVLGKPVRITGVEWPEGEPYDGDWRGLLKHSFASPAQADEEEE